MMSKQAWLFCGAGFVAGLVAGIAIADFAGHASEGAGATQMFSTLKFTELASSEERAFEAYKHQSPPIAIYALSESLDKMKEAEQYGEGPLLNKQILGDEMILAHARLAKLYTQTGETNLAARHFAEALRNAKESGRSSWFTNRDTLMQFVAKIDSVAK